MVAAQKLAAAVLGHVEPIISQLISRIRGRIVGAVLIITGDHQVSRLFVVLHDDGNHIGEGVDLCLHLLTLGTVCQVGRSSHGDPLAVVDAAQFLPAGGSPRHVVMEVVASLAEMHQLDLLDDKVFSGVMTQVEAANAPPEAEGARKGVARLGVAREAQFARVAQSVLHLAPHGQDDGTRGARTFQVNGVHHGVEVLSDGLIAAAGGGMVQISVEGAVTRGHVVVGVADHQRPVRFTGRQTLRDRERDVARPGGDVGVLVGDVVAILGEEQHVHVLQVAFVRVGGHGARVRLHAVDRESYTQHPGTARIGACERIRIVPHAPRNGGGDQQSREELAEAAAESVFHSVLHVILMFFYIH